MDYTYEHVIVQSGRSRYGNSQSGSCIHTPVMFQMRNLVEKDLSVRIHECHYCNLRMDRDINAARNILKRGLGAARHVRGNRQISEPLSVSTCGI